MHITLVGISHKTAPVAVREQFAFGAEELAPALRRLNATFDTAAALLSTCNRTEAYLVGHHVVRSDAAIDLLRELKDVRQQFVAGSFYHVTGREAVRHLFRVAAGVESMVVGESEILGQVRSAFAAATAAGTHNAVLSRLFHTAIRVGRQARSQTQINRHAVSVSSTAVALARRIVGDLSAPTVLVVSAGEAGKLAARSLVEAGAARLLVTSRTAARARALADELQGEPVDFQRLPQALAEADVVISSSAAPGFVIGRAVVHRATTQRNGRPLLLIDIAVPRDIDPAVRELPDVHLYDIDDLQSLIEGNLRARRQEVAKVERLVEEQVARFADWLRARGVVPTVAALRAQADAVRQAELRRTLKRLPNLTPKQQRALEAMTASLMKKLLHQPIARLKGSDGERYVPAVRDLFALDGAPPVDGHDAPTEG